MIALSDFHSELTDDPRFALGVSYPVLVEALIDAEERREQISNRVDERQIGRTVRSSMMLDRTPLQGLLSICAELTMEVVISWRDSEGPVRLVVRLMPELVFVEESTDLFLANPQLLDVLQQVNGQPMGADAPAGWIQVVDAIVAVGEFAQNSGGMSWLSLRNSGDPVAITVVLGTEEQYVGS